MALEEVKLFCVLTLLAGLWPQIVAQAQVPWEEEFGPPEICSLHIVSDIKYRFATTLVTSRVANPEKVAAEAVFDVTLPDEAFISNFSLEIDGKVYPGKVKEKAQAKKEYEKAKRKGQTAGHVSRRVKETNKFRVEVNIAAQSGVKFNLIYKEVLKRRLGFYNHVIYVDPGQPVADLKIDVAIQESRDITVLRVPPIKNEFLTDSNITAKNDLATIQRPSTKSAFIRFHPSLDEQVRWWTEGISGLFKVEYDVKRDYDAGDVLIANGFFVHFFAPDISTYIPKDILFIIDTSGSMAGTKMQQVKDAMSVILKDLKEDDQFNIMEFDDKSSLWQCDEMVPVTEANIQMALNYLESLTADKWTNINEALSKGLKFLNAHTRRLDSSLLIFLTDGAASKGERNSEKILNNVRGWNEKESPIYSLAFGKDADWDFVKKVGIQNNGIGRRIYEVADSSKQISGFYKEVSITLLNGVKFNYEDNVIEDSLTTSTFKKYFEGSEMMVAGKLTDLDFQTISMNVVANASEGPVDLQLSTSVPDLQNEFTDLTNSDDLARITEEMWAYLTIKELLKKMDGEENPTQKANLKQKATQMSLKYQFVTPLTSMIVTKPEAEKFSAFDDDGFTLDGSGSRHHNKSSKQIGRGGSGGASRGGAKQSSSGRSGRASRGGARQSRSGGSGGASRGGGGGDPHFMINMKSLYHPICFDVRGEAHQIYQLLRDPTSGLTINVRLGKGKHHNRFGGFRVYIVEVAVILRDTLLLVTRHNITLNDVHMPWGNHANLRVPGAWLHIQHVSLRLVFDSGVAIDITKHVHLADNPIGSDFLNVEVEKEDKLSKATDGIIGQFVHKRIALKKLNFKGKKIVGHLKTKIGNHVEHGRVWIVQRLDSVLNQTVPCWMLRKSGQQIFDNPPEYYLLDNIFQN